MEIALLVVWASTILWITLDARRRKWSNPVAPGRAKMPTLNRPWKWAVAALLLWPIVFPVYVYRRANAPLRPPTLAPRRGAES